ncbi:excinuclease ABC subunit UvrC [bacterium]|nr:excinuclease ABC subunit UvrC [bacterium]MBU1599971.1 excinuclease ABC subunit UvrC [bacterium]
MELTIDIEKAPDESGVYLFKGKDKILYIGKARSLKKRLSSYREPKTEKQALLLRLTDNVEWLVTDSEIEALILEANLIKEHKPRFNVLLKDSKAYPFIKLTKEKFPRLCFSRRIRDDGWYFGPYPSPVLLRKTIRITKELFKIRGCKNRIQKTEDRTQNPCLAFHINQCLAPCAGKVTEEEYQLAVKNVLSFLSSGHSQLVKQLKTRMKQEAKRLNFEESAKLRDRIEAIRLLESDQKVWFRQPIDIDIIASFPSGDRVCLLLFSIHRGKLVAEYPFFFANKENLLAGFIEQYYLSIPNIPNQIAIEEEIEDTELLSLWLSEKKKSQVKIFVPKRGKKKELLSLCKRNAKGFLVRRGEATISIKDVLSLRKEPEIIEGIDVSNIGGKDAYGSVVVFENGAPRKDLYRAFKIQTIDTPDDYGMIREVIKRRYSRLKEEVSYQAAFKMITRRQGGGDESVLDNTLEEPTTKPTQLAFEGDLVSRLPDLILIDGGAGHLNIAYRTLMELGLADIPLVSIAKSPDRCFLLHKKEPILISSAPSLLTLSFVRDEAHRFSLRFHRRKREKIHNSLAI